MAASSRRARKSCDFSLLQAALNNALKLGLRPFDPADPDLEAPACAFVEKILDLPAGFVADAVLRGQLAQNAALYNEQDPHAELFSFLHNAGIEITTDDRARRQNLSLREDNKRLRKLLASTDKNELTMEDVRARLANIARLTPQKPDWVVASRSPTKGPGVPMALLTDVHYGEHVKKKAMSGKNDYTPDIADKRLIHLVNRQIDTPLRHQVNPDYPGIVICVGGDLFSGDGIHEELNDTNTEKTLALFQRLYGRLIWYYETLLEAYPYVYTPWDYGNHSRTTQKLRYKLATETNYEFLLGVMLQNYFVRHPKYKNRIAFDLSDGAGVHFSVGGNPRKNVPGHRYFLIHGHFTGTKGGDGIIGAIGPIQRGLVKIKESEASIGRPFDTLLMGHYHRDYIGWGVISNGSVIGWGEHARLGLRAVYSKPVQLLWFNHPVLGPVSYHRIVLEDGFESAEAPTTNVFPGHAEDGPARGKGRRKKTPSASLDNAT